ncbi:hypothetical protein GOBAR_DD10291 [Gossypium barbadense]|nr:hypothetical protein GOBAR_DD10291 [Gossypium barbadense]
MAEQSLLSSTVDKYHGWSVGVCNRLLLGKNIINDIIAYFQREARKAGLAPAEFDEDGKEINPYIHQYISSAPWYLNAERPSLKHQRKWRSDPNYTKSWYDRGAKIFQAEKYRKGACENCGAMTHDAKSCIERPRKKRAKWTNMHIATDEKIETFEQDYDGKRDRWNGYDASTYARVIERYEARVEARRKYLKEQQLKKLGRRKIVDEAKIDESKQMDFAKLAKHVRTTGGGSMGTGDNQYRMSGQALEFKQLNIHAWEAFDKGQDIICRLLHPKLSYAGCSIPS